MTNLLLGLGQVIANAFGEVITNLLTPLIKLAMDFILLPILELLFTIISYVLGLVGFYCGAFILKLIDFVEVLFRALAGLESTGNTGMSMSLSLDGQSGDILIQLIRNKDIQQAFLAMCIVGLFLLVVTSVFQIIKVEYTTEGSKNAKGPIFNKAFRGLCNLMLIPILVIFGIFMANQVLGLIDKATSVQGDNPTISGLIFVASASDAHYYEKEAHTCFDIAGEGSNATNGGSESSGLLFNVAVSQALLEAVDAWLETLGEDSEGLPIYGNTYQYASQIDQIENDFISQTEGYKYYDLNNVSDYYNYSRINYFLMLFGGVFALKCLFFTSFGLVIRLYKCAILFIISPMIIGWSPVSDNLGKWRSSFIGQVLAAYGTVLSINLFFVVIRVLLNIEIKFTSTSEWGVSSGALSSSFMTLLLKCIFVLAGCLMIEKFSKELGGYFGAEDSMSAGKDMANQVGDLAMKGVATAAMIGTGGAALAMKGAGIAQKVSGHFSKDARDERVSAKRGKSSLKNLSEEGSKQQREESAAYLDAFKGIDDSWSDRKKEEHVRTNLAKKGITPSSNLSFNDLKTKQEHAKDIASYDKQQQNKKETREKRKESFARAKMNIGSAMYGFAEEGKGNLPFKNIRKKFTDAEKNGAEMLGDDFKTAYDVTHKDKKDHKTEKDTAEKLFAGSIKTINTAGAIQIVGRLGTASEESEKKQIDGFNKYYNYARSSYQGARNDEEKRIIAQEFRKYAFENNLKIDFNNASKYLERGDDAKSQFEEVVNKYNSGIKDKIESIKKEILGKKNVSIEEIQESIKKEFEGSNEMVMKKLLEEIKKITDDLSK